MKLFMLNYEFPPIGGGAANANLCLLREYARDSSLTVTVLTSAPEPGFFEEKLADNIVIYKVGIHKKSLHYWRRTEVIEWLFKASRHYSRLLGQNDYDLVHAFFGFPTGYLCYKTAQELLYIISLRGSDVPGYNVRLGLDYRLTAGLFRRIWTGASAVVANSTGLRRLASKFMTDLDIKVIPNGIDTEKFHPPDRRDPAQTIELLTVGRLITRKRIDLLLKAAHCADKLGLNVRLNIAGDGNILGKLKGIAGELNLAEKVKFLQRVPPEDMPALYRSNTIFLMASAHEGMSNAMLEAMASGLPIITTPCEGVEELIGDNGIVVQSERPEDIARAIKDLADDPRRMERLSLAAVEKAKQFTWAGVARRYLNCYEQIVKQKNKNRTSE
ncbi:MAG: glycosyltransferase family 4 protein [Sedimentisphaerales bacterium]|nr:glycosyltransferase family 4 protein [Sedimentisphaerales bacterium]